MLITAIATLFTLIIFSVYFFISSIFQWILRFTQKPQRQVIAEKDGDQFNTLKDANATRRFAIILLPALIPIIDTFLFEQLFNNFDVRTNQEFINIAFFLIFLLNWALGFLVLFYLSNKFKISELIIDTQISIAFASTNLCPLIFTLLFIVPLPTGAEGAGGVAQGFAVGGMFIILVSSTFLLFIMLNLANAWRMFRLMKDFKIEKAVRSPNVG